MQSGETTIQNILKRKEFENNSSNKNELNKKNELNQSILINNIQRENLNQSPPTTFLNEKSMTEES